MHSSERSTHSRDTQTYRSGLEYIKQADQHQFWKQSRLSKHTKMRLLRCKRPWYYLSATRLRLRFRMRFCVLFQNLRKVCANITHVYTSAWYRTTKFGSVTIKLGSGNVFQGPTMLRWGLTGIGYNWHLEAGPGLFRCVEASCGLVMLFVFFTRAYACPLL